jgi:hypothetical protein
MNEAPPNGSQFDLIPEPRILPMLGEISLPQWRCVAELLDNSIDAFLNAARCQEAAEEPWIRVQLPTTDTPSGRVTIRDNGSGMTPDILQKAVRAGWTGNSPVGSLGLFGMGFNIATARLGTVTTVWTATPEALERHGLCIDFDELRRQRHFRTPHLTRPKTEEFKHGTEVTVEHLKPEQRTWLAKPANLRQIRQSLGAAYGAMLRDDGVPIHFKLTVNGQRVLPTNHCVWAEEREVETRWGRLPALLRIDSRLPDRPYCTACWQWLAANANDCPACGRADAVVNRSRHVHGWIGLQRHLSASDFGIDFIRHGRKIELANKDLFEWADGEVRTREYPIDDPRSRGRFVGEIHLDHCRVTYMKDRFDRTDPAWEEMVEIVRGQGPLRPERAFELGYGANDSPLFKLFQTFRRTSPHNTRIAGGWSKILVVKDNDRAVEMAGLFQRGEAEYQTDAKWWELVVEEDSRLLTPTEPVGATVLPGFGGDDVTDGGPRGPMPLLANPAHGPVPESLARQPIPSLTREYRHDPTGIRWDIHAFEVHPDDPGLPGSQAPWRTIRLTNGEDQFLVNPTHQVFASATMTLLDGLLCQLAWNAVDLTRGQPNAPTFSVILADLRERYGGPYRLDPLSIKTQADAVYSSLARVWSRGIPPEDCRALFEEDLDSSQQAAIFHKMALRTISNPQLVIERGRFLEFAPPRVLVDFVLKHPHLFFDGRCWDDKYTEIGYPSETATEEARSRVLRDYESLLLDTVWLIEHEVDDLAGASRERLLRGMLAVSLLQPVVPYEAGNA